MPLFNSEFQVRRKQRLLLNQLRGRVNAINRFLRRNPNHTKANDLAAIGSQLEIAVQNKGENDVFEAIFTSLENENESPQSFWQRIVQILKSVIGIIETLGPILDSLGGFMNLETEE